VYSRTKYICVGRNLWLKLRAIKDHDHQIPKIAQFLSFLRVSLFSCFLVMMRAVDEYRGAFQAVTLVIEIGFAINSTFRPKLRAAWLSPKGRVQNVEELSLQAGIRMALRDLKKAQLRMGKFVESMPHVSCSRSFMRM
jgi:hypothetical protein